MCLKDGKLNTVISIFWLKPFATSSNKCLTSSNKKLLGTGASLVVTSALLVVTRFATRNNKLIALCS